MNTDRSSQDNNSGARFRGFPAVTRGNVVIFGGKTPENDRKVEAVIRSSYPVAGFWLESGDSRHQI
jgi:hypothetical protein